jgi:two-component system cell cycle response regulator
VKGANVDTGRPVAFEDQRSFRDALQLLGTLDLEQLQEQALQTLARVTDAQGAALWVADERGALTLRGYRGVVDRGALAARIDPHAEPWSGAVARPAPLPAPGVGADEAFYVPLVANDELVGLALLADRARGRFGAAERAAALAMADVTAIAVRNARRFQALERVGLRDRETGAYNLAYFVDYAGKEFYKARRYARAFSLVVIAIDNVEQLRKAGGRDLYRRAMRDLVGAASRVVRDADILAKVSESEYYLLLPETDPFGAQIFMRRASEEIRGEASIRQLEERAPVLVSMGAAAFPRDGEDFDELLHWSRQRVEEQRGSAVRRLPLAELDRSAFWEVCDLLLSGASRIPGTSPSALLPADPDAFSTVQREVARELARDPRARGLVYIGGPGLARAPLRDALPAGEAAGRAGDASAHVYLLGPRGGDQPAAHHPQVTEVWLDGDKRLAGHQFILHLSEQGGYAWLSSQDGRAFHTSDAPLVDALVQRLQAHYELQPH